MEHTTTPPTPEVPPVRPGPTNPADAAARIVAMCRAANAGPLAALALERKASVVDVRRWLGWLEEIRPDCAAIGMPEADALDIVTAAIEGGLGAAIRRALAHAQAALDGPDIQTRFHPGAASVPPGKPHTTYRQRDAERARNLSKEVRR